MKKIFKPQTWLFPRPVVLISAKGKSGRDTITTVSWAGVACSEPPAISVALRKSRFAHKLIMETKEFVANLPTAEQVKIADYCGTESGAKVEKFKELSLTRENADKVDVPMIGECPVNLECKVKNILELGSHDLFIAEIVSIHVDEKILNEKGGLDEKKLNSLVWQTGNYYGIKPL